MYFRHGILALGLALGGVGCGGGEKKDAAGLDRAGLKREVSAATPQVEWPGGNSPKPELVLGPELKRADAEKSAETWQRGFGQTLTAIYYECVWSIEVVDAATDAARNEALKMLGSDQKYISWQGGDPETKAQVDARLKSAEAGDLSQFETMVDVNGCRDWKDGVFH